MFVSTVFQYLLEVLWDIKKKENNGFLKNFIGGYVFESQTVMKQ